MMRNPVISPSGHTYEKDLICTWLSTSKKCPFTQLELSVSQLRPNKNLYNFIKFAVLRERFNLKNHKDKIKLNEILVE